MLTKFYRKIEDDIYASLSNKIKKVLAMDSGDIIFEECYYIQSETSKILKEDFKKIESIISIENDLCEYPTVHNVDDCIVIEIGPRLDYSTPYSTNCVSICQSIGLYSISRFEKSMRYYLYCKNDSASKLKLKNKMLLIDDIYDKMTQMVYIRPLNSFVTNTMGLENGDKNPKKEYDINILGKGRMALENFNRQFGLGLDEYDITFYTTLFQDKLKRNPTNIECFDLAQSNSEHSRHWFFKGEQVIGGKVMEKTLMQMVCDTQKFSNPNNVIKFSDNSSAITGHEIMVTIPKPHEPAAFQVCPKTRHIIFTAETHNFPTGVSPFPGAATGIGGRIRDVQATGRGAHVIAGTAGYCVGNLHIPGYQLPGEDYGSLYPNLKVGLLRGTRYYPANLAGPLKILIEASNGASDYGNKFGEPIVCGFTRSFGALLTSALKNGSGEDEFKALERREWLKPIMFTGGIGSIDADKVTKEPPAKGMRVVKIGGPVYRIGLGGGSASSISSHGTNSIELDFQAVQRGDPEMEQKMNRVVRACAECPGASNPFLSIHDQGAGGNGNVLKELVEPLGGTFDVSAFSLGDKSSGPMEVWAAEYQESNAALIAAPYTSRFENSDQSDGSVSLNSAKIAHRSSQNGGGHGDLLSAICKREKCPLDVVGTVTGDGNVTLVDHRLDKLAGALAHTAAIAEPGLKRSSSQMTNGSTEAQKAYVDLPLSLIGSSCQKTFYSDPYDADEYSTPLTLCPSAPAPFDLANLDIGEALDRVLRLPSVCSKRFLTNKVDRSVTGLVARQQCVGPTHVPLADAAILALSHFGTPVASTPLHQDRPIFRGSATAVGEQPIKTMLDPEAGARMSLGESLTNLCAGAVISCLRDTKASFNWMWPAKSGGSEGAKMYAACKALCEAAQGLGVAADGGKDSLSMAASFELPPTPRDGSVANGTVCVDDREKVTVKGPGSVVISVYAPCPDITVHVTPDLKCAYGGNSSTTLLWVCFNCDDRHASNLTPRLDGSALYQCYGALGSSKTAFPGSGVPDLDQPSVFAACFGLTQALVADGTVLAAHDVSDGGLLTAVLEMAFASGRTNLTLRLDDGMAMGPDRGREHAAVIRFLFAEELGIILEVDDGKVPRVLDTYKSADLGTGGSIVCLPLGQCTPYKKCGGSDDFGPMLKIMRGTGSHEHPLFSRSIPSLKSTWEATAFELEKLQVADQLCVESESRNENSNATHPVPSVMSSESGKLVTCYWTTFSMEPVVDRWLKVVAKLSPLNASMDSAIEVSAPTINVPSPFPASLDPKWRVAILREEGTNGDRELASAFISAGFETWDVTMTDLVAKRVTLSPDVFRGVAFAGGFSYGDVLGSAKGWAASILHNPDINSQFRDFRAHPKTFALGVCNGCQLMAALGWVAPDSQNAPGSASPGLTLKHNKSGRFESRFSKVVIQDGPCIFTKGMAGSLLGVWVAHGEGKMVFKNDQILEQVTGDRLCPIKYVGFGDTKPTQEYPANPNGSVSGIAGLCSQDGRVFALMPHPERSFLGWQWPWLPPCHVTDTGISSGDSIETGAYYPFDSSFKPSPSPWLKMFQNAYDWCDKNS